jgi:two-component system response regulator PilR (NtrC family)
VRILAATHRDLKAEIAAGRFREDLFFRLTVVEIKLPRCGSGPPEIPELAAVLLRQINQRYQQPRQLTAEALERLVTHDWPGNTRELQNVLERAAISASGGVIRAKDLELPIRTGRGGMDQAAGTWAGLSTVKRFSTMPNGSWSTGRWNAAAATRRKQQRCWGSRTSGEQDPAGRG